MKNKGSVSLRDIAEKAGVARMTVSKALRGHKDVSADTRERIKRIAKELGYKPNPKVAAAMTAIAQTGHAIESGRLAFLTTHETADGWRKYPHIVSLFEGARARALEYGYELEPFWALKPGKNLSDFFYARGIDGVLLPPIGPQLSSQERRIIDFDWSRASVVEIDEQLDEPVFRIVRHDHYLSMLEALYRMESLGYRRIGLALSRAADARNRHRWSAAYLLWSKTRFSEKEIPLFLYDDSDSADIGSWIVKHEVDSVLGLASEFPLLKDAGFACPDDLGFAVLHCMEVPGETIVCSGIEQDAEGMAATAMDLLVGLVRTGTKGPPEKPTQLICEGFWTDGDTTRRVGPPLNDRSVYHAVLSL